MVVVDFYFGDNTWQYDEFEAVPRVGEYIILDGKSYEVDAVWHNFDVPDSLVQVEIGLRPLSSSNRKRR